MVLNWLKENVQKAREGMASEVSKFRNHSFMEAIVGRPTIQQRFFIISSLIKVMSKLMVYNGKLFTGFLNTHFNAKIIDIIQIPSARMTNYIAVRRLLK